MSVRRGAAPTHSLALLARLVARPDEAFLADAEDCASDVELRLLAALQELDTWLTSFDDVLTRLDLLDVDDDVLELARWLITAPASLRDQGARIMATRTQPVVAPVGALRAWRDLVRSGRYEPHRHGELRRAACREADGNEFAAMGLPFLAAKCMDEARAIVLAAAEQMRSA